MKTRDLLTETYTALWVNKVRTGLTVLGIVIGIGSVIAMVSIGQGAQGSIEANIQSLGSNLVQVVPGSQSSAGRVSEGRGSAKTLTLEDATAIENEVSGVQAVSAEASSRYQVIGKGTNTNTTVVGVEPDYLSVRNLNIAEGSFISDQNLKGLSKVAVLGPSVRDDLFGADASAVGQNIRINGQQFQVIGITVPKGGSGFQNQDDMIYLPLSSMQKFLTGNVYLSTIAVQAQNADLMDQVENDTSNLLLERHHISDPTAADFSIFNQNDVVATASSVTKTFTILLGSVAGISLIVGGIGIMNMMLTNVTERTREIGLRKAIGAKKKDINLQFLTEAILLTMIGGIVGTLLGSIVSISVSSLGIIQTKISISSILLAFGVSGAIGIIFGYYPARRAANLKPIEALRYE